MRKLELGSLKQALIRGGVAHSIVTRTLAELHDHYEDLERESIDAGRSLDEAADEARERLGEQRVIADHVLSRPPLLSWAFRWAWVPAVLRQLVVLASITTVPVTVIVSRGSVITRWCVSTGIALLLTSGLLLLLQRVVVAHFFL